MTTTSPHPTDALPSFVETSPERIYLVLGDELEEGDKFNDLDEITWCQDKQYDTDIEYVRADVARREGFELAVGSSLSSDEWRAIVKSLGAALKRLTFAVRTTGGTAGPDAELMLACEQAESVLTMKGIDEALASQPAQEQANAQGKINAELDIHSNHAEPQQRRNMACAVEMGQPVGDRKDSLSGDIEPQGAQSLERWLCGILKPIAEDIAKNCSTAPQLVIAPLIWGIGDLVKSGALCASKLPVAQQQAGTR